MKFHVKFWRFWSKNWYSQLSWWVLEDLWVQEVKVILWPLTLDFLGITISYNSKATGQVVFTFYVEPLWAEGTQIVQTLQVAGPTRPPCPCMVITFINLLRNHLSDGTWTLIWSISYYQNCSNNDLWFTLTFLRQGQTKEMLVSVLLSDMEIQWTFTALNTRSQAHSCRSKAGDGNLELKLQWALWPMGFLLVKSSGEFWLLFPYRTQYFF